MQRAKYDLRKVICKNSSFIGYSSNVAKPGYWIAWRDGTGCQRVGRVMGRIAEHETTGQPCKGWLAVMRLSMECTHAGVSWVDPATVTHCYEKAPADLLAWITGDEWVKNRADVARLIAMSQHGTTSQGFIKNRDNPDQAYNARPEYAKQWILA